VSFVANLVDKLGERVVVNLERIPDFDQNVVVGSGVESYELDRIIFGATKPVAAPVEYSVLGDSELTNVWRCVRDSSLGEYCSSIGNGSYGLEWRMIGESAISGVGVRYRGGYGGWETEIQFLCNWSIDGCQIVVDDVGEFQSDGLIVIRLRGREFCPGYEFRMKMTGGAMFLLVVALIVILYLGIGTIVLWVRKGGLDFPNRVFWEGAAESVRFAVLFIVTCGRRRPVIEPTLDVA
jgi:hypothetical protein